MTLRKLLFGFEGRIGRVTYWLAIPAVLAAMLVLSFWPFLLGNEEAAVLIGAFTSNVFMLLGLWPLLAVGSKRLHDRNKNGWWLLLFWLAPLLLFSFGFSIDFLGDPEKLRSGNLSTGSILFLAGIPPALWGIVELGLLPGTRDTNAYGTEP